MGENVTDKLKNWAANLDIEAAAPENHSDKFPITKAGLLEALPRAAEHAKFKDLEIQTKTPADLLAETVTTLGLGYGVIARRVAVSGINSGGALYNEVLARAEGKADGILKNVLDDNMQITKEQYGELYNSLKSYQTTLKNPASSTAEIETAQDNLIQSAGGIVHSTIKEEKLKAASEKIENSINKVEDKLEKAKSFFKGLKKTSAENNYDSARALKDSGLSLPDESETGLKASTVKDYVSAIKAKQSSQTV